MLNVVIMVADYSWAVVAGSAFLAFHPLSLFSSMFLSYITIFCTIYSIFNLFSFYKYQINPNLATVTSYFMLILVNLWFPTNRMRILVQILSM